MEPLVLRLHETQAYDVWEDEQILTLMGTTGTGTYYCRMPAGTGSQLRKARAQFKDYVMNCMREGIPPHEAELDGSTSDH